MSKSFATACLALALTGCSAWPGTDVARRDMTHTAPDPALPMARFAPITGLAPEQSNAQLAVDFLELEFALETGRALPRLTRFEGPITYAFHGPAPETAQTDLNQLIQRLQAEAGIALGPAPVGKTASITLNFIPKAVMRRSNPGVACYVVPGISTARDERLGQPRQDWASLTRRERLAIFLPGDGSPQEVRDCLHEELAQALGPLNDVYRLSDSVFNDDNFHTVLTGYDMLMLRLHYAPEFAGAPDRETVAALLPKVLARLNPSGQQGAKAQPSQPTPDGWETAMEKALADQGSTNDRLRAARQALAIARDQGWQDGRLAFSLFALGRASLARDPAQAVGLFQESARLYRQLPGGQVQAAHVDMQTAALALSQGQFGIVEALALRNMETLEQAQNAALLATFLLLRAEAADQRGEPAQASLWRKQGLGWARYGFGREQDLEQRVKAIATLVRPLAKTSRGG